MPIDKNKTYTLYELVSIGAFPWIKKPTYHSYKGVIIDDLLGANVLKTKKVAGTRGMSYQIKGSNIIKYCSDKK